jgi:hypothetical protein
MEVYDIRSGYLHCFIRYPYGRIRIKCLTWEEKGYRKVKYYPIVNFKTTPHEIFIAWPSKWCHPDKKVPLKEYEQWVRSQPQLMESIEELRERTLGCWCPPKACHGDVLLYLLQERDQ